MKKVFLIISGVWLLVSTVIVVNGQLASNNVKQSGTFIILNKAESEHATYVGRVNPPVIRNFLKTYKNVSGEKWIEVKDGFVAMFNYIDVDYQVAYTKKGNRSGPSGLTTKTRCRQNCGILLKAPITITR